MESILTSIKKLLGIVEEDESFDADIIIHINSVFNALTQIGVGPEEGFEISDKEKVWSDYVTDGSLNLVKSYIYFKVKSMFDPPQIGSLSEAIDKQIKELEFRISITVDPRKEVADE